MASTLEAQVFNYDLETQIQVIPNIPVIQPPLHQKKTVVVPSIKKTLTKMNVFLISTVFCLLTAESVIYFHSVQTGINANKLQADINKLREDNDFLKVELANSKELAKVENVAINALQMKPADSSKISYLAMPNQVTDKQYLVTNISPKEKRVFVPVGY